MNVGICNIGRLVYKANMSISAPIEEGSRSSFTYLAQKGELMIDISSTNTFDELPTVNGIGRAKTLDEPPATPADGLRAK